jgi:hypothetical protein
MDLEIINRLYLELSHVATAKTAKEIALEDKIELFRLFVSECRHARADRIEAIKREADVLFSQLFLKCAYCGQPFHKHAPTCMKQ